MAQLLSNLPIGAKIKFGKYSVRGETAQPIIWVVVAKNHSSTPAYPTNCVTLLTQKSIDLLAADAREVTNSITERRNYGNNRYSFSNIDQWLNTDGNGGSWYSAQHSADQAPDSESPMPNEVPVISNGVEYSTRPGFLNAFTSAEKNVILSTTIRVVKSSVDGGGYEDISRKVFLPSVTELGLADENGIAEGGKWSYFDGTLSAPLTNQAYSNTLSNYKPATVSGTWRWWLRTAYYTNGYSLRCINDKGALDGTQAYIGSTGVRPALNILSAVSASDTTDSDGCYTIVPNSTPSAPSYLNVPTAIYGGKTNAISWGNAVDLDGNSVTYQLECSVNGGTYAQIYSGNGTTYAHLVPYGTATVAYRVKATDPVGASSAYVTSTTMTVINNKAPVISGSDSNLGVKSSGFVGSYTITDANSDAVTVTESIDGVQIRALVATLNTPIPYSISGNTWLTLPNGSHTFTITATDGIDTTVRTYVFTKLVDKFTIQNSTPWVTSTRPSRIMLVITRNIPSGAKFKVEVCNNGCDSEPTWEDCTDAVTSGLVHVFANQEAQDLTLWGVLVRVTVERNGAAGACYVSAIGGNFE